MAFSSLSLLSLSSISPPPKPPHNKTPTFSLLSSPKPRTTRRNYLRPKLPTRTRPPEPATLQTPQLPLLIQELEEEEKVEEEKVDSVEPVQELTHQSQILEPLPNPNHNHRSFVLDLSLRFAAFLAVQTVTAVWILGGGRKREEEEATVRVLEEEKVVDEREKVKEGSEFERVVSNIRAMAREARVQEAKELERSEIERERLGFKKVGMGENVKEGLSGGKLGSRKRLGFVKSNVSRRMTVGKGFNGVKKVEEGGNVGDSGGIGQIVHKNPIRESTVAPPVSTSDSDADDNSLVLPYEKSLSLGDLHPSQRTIESSESDNHKASLVNHKSTQREIQTKQTSKEGEQLSSRKSHKINGRSKSRSQKKEAVGKSVISKYKNSLFDKGKKPWWLKLPFVLAILLRRGFDRSGPNGLYSLKMDPTSEDGASVSYTIVFQDQGDATNFCYLLESFFEEMVGCNADVIPLTINELEEGVRSGELKVIVVRKGQLQLYAGQPLTEVETALRSLLDKQQSSEQG